MRRLDIDLTSYSASERTFVDLFEIYGRESLITEFLLGLEREDATVKAFKEFAGIQKDPFANREVFLASLHVTTNNDFCETLKRKGLLNLQSALIEDTPLKVFFQEHGITVDPNRAELTHQGKTYKLNPLSRYATGEGEEWHIQQVSFKLYRDEPVWGFVCSNNVFGYGGHVDKRPEFLKDVGDLVGIPEMVNQWEEQTSTYILKFSLPNRKYDYPKELEFLGDLVVKTVYDYLIHGGPRENVISYLPIGEKVRSHEIVFYYTVDEFNRYLDS
ncbi:MULTISPECIES: hypothetical protein [unclassified Paenibacillus]|uniref:Uncharacterized protein n=1 Tax=Paenibacillus provencensis TaxID=441151 RepID=A0ABW3Q852_9BACL|nr:MULTISPECIES: hypothetical protein [unclassified Paenibacillus]MCM3130993.1 hypothetical protein [Paenibacillus sp. MER 78]SDX87912.1 hypothetical protein SAMN05518848_12225 [Paenibacillus sp. PDC88]SFS99211.1 hypothetical protein SAMN04488601_1156 [Paenibacillus sp. 453mf]